VQEEQSGRKNPAASLIMLHTSITLSQVEDLEETFAERTETGWVIPEWLVYLRTVVEGEPTVPNALN
jgi:hypothetical protein